MSVKFEAHYCNSNLKKTENIIQLDGKYSETVQLPAKTKFGGFVPNTCHTYY